MKQMQLKVGLACFVLLGFAGLSAQESINTSGVNAMGSGGSVSYSVGQVVYTIATGLSGYLSPGIQQPYEISLVTDIEEPKDIILSVSAFPNPTIDNLTLTINDYENYIRLSSSVSYQLYSLSGKLLQSKTITSQQTSIDMSSLVPATYFVKVIKTDNNIRVKQSSCQHEIGTFKIIKY